MSCCFCVNTASLGIVESFGKFERVAAPGCHCLIPCVETVRGRVTVKLQFSSVNVETKTKDNALVLITACLHYRVLPSEASNAFYRFSNPREQIASFAANVIRGEVPKYTLDEIFVMSRNIKQTVEEELKERLSQYGFALEATLVTRIEPTQELQVAIEQTQLNAYRRTAAEHKAELDKIVEIKASEAAFEEKRLAGVGLAEERRAIMEGLQSSIESFVDGVPGVGARDVVQLLLMNQYFDSLKEVGNTGNNQVVLLPPKGSQSLLTDLLAAQRTNVSMR
ncbi:hypersensitive-induced reaction protein 1 [Trypanosoma rangeli]|uniref:Hypersensitive-induced reaction protein 1 n=1 Tax=Trypanosoma rangeli TaxID=5698 RepID=A0A3R7NUY2_TRYRA|nr:hypersensitive-induced reaction protein 1 [Trypanosoma rangeli]RNF08132.1 hypersensitive-induced reaction protein 1 [Trypanosoma rangeli]|eukprot:RNF08132.1 hypersensitive-induced reaction protein 1 [Trypanosoma rangeli]